MSPSRRAGRLDGDARVRVLHAIIGPAGHGVVEHAIRLLDQPPLAHHAAVRLHEPTAVLGLADSTLLHLHVTDHLLGASPAQAAHLVTELARRRRVSLTLHDLPQPSDGAQWHPRRAAAYAELARVAVGVIVASRHEWRLLLQAADGARPGMTRPEIVVVPLPIERGTLGQPPGWRPAGRDLTVFGYLYPGKGHREALAALPLLPEEVGVTALGGASPGHDRLLAEYDALARGSGRRFTVTGHLDDAVVRERLRAAAIPVAPAAHVSASGSIGSWLAAGRRPIAPSNTYTDELESRCPGALLRYGAGAPYATLVDACRAVLADPSLSWLDPQVVLTPTPDEAARRYAATLDDWARR